MNMLGKYVRVKVTHPINSHNAEENITYNLNFGQVEGSKHFNSSVKGAYIMGISHPVRSFDGRVIAVLHYKDKNSVYIVVAPKSTRFINIDIKSAMEFALKNRDYSLDCLYERSCGAVVFREIGGMTRFLLIKNKRSAHWGFPKGHVEQGETDQQTAYREVLEETGIRINILPDFVTKSQYSIQGKVEKSVNIYLATTEDTNTIIQKEEIEDYVWLGYEKAKTRLKFENDHAILDKAVDYIAKNNLKV
ncbi:MAG: NUDIX domain-containing protein [Clostridia bacterium]|nr:NUDIX domain-containing protein [Clostridia bacterium]